MNWQEIAWFTRGEFDCGCGCKFNNVTPELAKLLDSARKQIGAPVIITSGSRCEKHNETVGGGAWSRHKDGTAADVVTKTYLMDNLERALKTEHSWTKRYPRHIHVHLIHLRGS